MTDAELAVLSILAEGPSPGVSFGGDRPSRSARLDGHRRRSLAYLLEKLEQQGLADGDGPRGEPMQRRWRLTPAGLGVLKTAVVELLSTRASRTAPSN